MKVRRDALAVSGLLFTLALLMPLPTLLEDALTVPQTSFKVADQVSIQNYFAPVGFASLAVIVTGLIVTWAAYVKGVRWAWFVMFVVVWVWGFPVLLLPWLQRFKNEVPVTEILSDATRGPGTARAIVESVLTLLLMVLALVLPIKTFIVGQGGGPGKPGRANSGAPDKRSMPEA